MNLPVWLSPSLSLVATVLTLVIGFAMIRKRIRTELLAEFKKGLRTERLETYRTLWRKLNSVALYAPPRDLTCEALSDMSRDLSEWYFDHGMFLSVGCRDYYFVLQDTLQLLLRVDTKPEYVLRAQEDRITQKELERVEERLGLKKDVRPTVEELETDVLTQLGTDAKTDYHVLRYVSSQLRTRLSEDLETREGLWTGLVQPKNWTSL